MLHINTVSEKGINDSELIKHIDELLNKFQTNSILVIPPDGTRWHSKAGFITEQIYKNKKNSIKTVIPALGTHTPMDSNSISHMFGSTPKELFKVHDWKNDVVTVGTIEGKEVAEVTDGLVEYDFPVQINKELLQNKYDLIISIGQVVPHEIAGMANYNKNIIVGVGGEQAINKSHFISGAYGIEKVLGRAKNPVRKIFDIATERFLKNLPILYIQTVIGTDDNGNPQLKGLFAGDDRECFDKAAELSAKINIFTEPKAAKKVVAWMDPAKYKSCWLANKAIYRTRMLVADGGELVIIAPGIERFGEDADNDRLIRKHGYCGTKKAMELAKNDVEMQNNLGVITHLIYGSSDGRFKITYCTGDKITKDEIINVGYDYMPAADVMNKYNPKTLKAGWNKLSDEEIYFIPDSGLGLWAEKSKYSK